MSSSVQGDSAQKVLLAWLGGPLVGLSAVSYVGALKETVTVQRQFVFDQEKLRGVLAPVPAGTEDLLVVRAAVVVRVHPAGEVATPVVGALQQRLLASG